MNVTNRTLFIADNLDIMRGMDSETIDLIYLDPPFNTNRNYKAPIGTPAEGAEFKDIWRDEDVKYGQYSEIAVSHPHIHQIIEASAHTADRSMMIYLMAMSIRLIEMKRILKPTGSIYLHCDMTASHYLKLVMDDVFGRGNFRNEIVWHYQAGTSPKTAFGRKHDTIIAYSKSSKPVFNRQSKPVRNPKRYKFIDENGRPYDVNGQGKRYYLDQGQTCDDVWTYVQEKQYQQLNSRSKERTGYPTQKPIALLERIIKASSNEGDMVLDPFCGCATACIAAEQLDRQWIGIDIAASAEKITKDRLIKEVQPEQPEFWHDVDARVIVTSQVPIRTDIHQYRAELKQRKLPHYRVHKNTLYGMQAGNCTGCERHFEIRNLTVDHINPRSEGGTDHIENLQLLCQTCNSTKGTGTQEKLISRLKEQGVRK